MYRIKPSNLIRYDLLVCDLCGKTAADWYDREWNFSGSVTYEEGFGYDKPSEVSMGIKGEALCRECATSMSHIGAGAKKEDANG